MKNQAYQMEEEKRQLHARHNAVTDAINKHPLQAIKSGLEVIRLNIVNGIALTGDERRMLGEMQDSIELYLQADLENQVTPR